MKILEKFFGKDNISYNIYSTELMPLKGTITYRFYVFANYYFETKKEWKEQWATMFTSEKDHTAKFISQLKKDNHFLNAKKFKINNKIYTKQELIKKLKDEQ